MGIIAPLSLTLLLPTCRAAVYRVVVIPHHAVDRVAVPTAFRAPFSRPLVSALAPSLPLPLPPTSRAGRLVVLGDEFVLGAGPGHCASVGHVVVHVAAARASSPGPRSPHLLMPIVEIKIHCSKMLHKYVHTYPTVTNGTCMYVVEHGKQELPRPTC